MDTQRRVPLLNQSAPGAGVMAAEPVAKNPAPLQRPESALTPYDRYAENGSELPPPSSQKADVRSGEEEDLADQFLGWAKRGIASIVPSMEAKKAAVQTAETGLPEGRKPIRGNPPFALATHSSASAAPLEVKPEPVAEMQAPKRPDAPVLPEISVAPQKVSVENTDASAEPEKRHTSWFGRLLMGEEGYVENAPEPAPSSGMLAMSDTPDEAKAATPALSSVPKAPGRFQEIRHEHSQDQQDLLNERDNSEKEKSGLGAEPSELAPSPQLTPPPQSAAPAPEVLAHAEAPGPASIVPEMSAEESPVALAPPAVEKSLETADEGNSVSIQESIAAFFEREKPAEKAPPAVMESEPSYPLEAPQRSVESAVHEEAMPLEALDTASLSATGEARNEKNADNAQTIPLENLKQVYPAAPVMLPSSRYSGRREAVALRHSSN